MLFDTDKIARRKHIEQRPLTAKDERVLKELGILRTQQVLQPLEAQYDKNCIAGFGNQYIVII